MNENSAASPRAPNLKGAGAVSPRKNRSRNRGVPTGSPRSWLDGINTVRTDETDGAGVVVVDGSGRNRDTLGRVLARLAYSRGAPPARGAAPAAVAVRRRVREKMRSEDGFTVGGAGGPGQAGADAVGPMVSTESFPCVGLLEGVGWATGVAAAGASAGPAPTSVGTAKNGVKSLSAAGKARLRLGQRSTAATDAESRATNLPQVAERSSILIRGPCV